MKVGTIVNIMHVFKQYEQKINDDYDYLEYCKHTGNKFKIQEAREKLNEDKAKMGEFLDYDI